MGNSGHILSFMLFYPVFNLLMFYTLLLLVVLSFTQLASTIQANILALCAHIHACHMHDKKMLEPNRQYNSS